MNPYVVGISGASAQQLAERALEWLMRRDRTVHVIMSRGAHEVWRAERSISVPVDPKLQEQFWRERFKIDTGTLICHRWDDQSALLPAAVWPPAEWSWFRAHGNRLAVLRQDWLAIY